MSEGERDLFDVTGLTLTGLPGSGIRPTSIDEGTFGLPIVVSDLVTKGYIPISIPGRMQSVGPLTYSKDGRIYSGWRSSTS